ncbi:hypothetical protein GRX03_03885 [Halovenus sp. WSH3]|uniref:DUF1102 domain-containing protein n=1 Tax=Halovenus carboxidivorans TaxID=2692199 RepID=A0A6B0T3H5_9EURY|nr:hypothetical protein [Halovenus carboxidivorans]MXR50746.1 hypothetical protein [Halovenus carboxidivorans]
MNRRQLIIGAGAATVGAVSILGSGAFTSVSAERKISISVADDDRAFLRMEPLVKEGIDGEATGRSSTNGRQVEFEIPGDDNGENSAAGGVGLDSVYEFHDLLEVHNQGTQPVTLSSTYDGDAFADLALVTDSGVLREDPPALGVGDSIAVGLQIDTHGSDPGEFEEELTIVAERVGGNRD